MNILDKIVEEKRREVALLKATVSTSTLRKSPFFERTCISLKQRLQSSEIGIIAEFKRQSPSKGIINNTSTIVDVVDDYEKAGANGISILTDRTFFGGKSEDIIAVRSKCTLPILRKDFIVDEYQLVEAKSMGADVVLLIASILNPEKTKALAMVAQSLGLEVLLEIREESELDRLNDAVDLVGVNNRNLKTFEVNIDQSVQLSALIPDQFLKISESGISVPSTISELKNYGYRGFLMGETFMKTTSPGTTCQSFIEQLKQQPHEN
jgi:indole-3-glycerol phosphate synthase